MYGRRTSRGALSRDEKVPFMGVGEAALAFKLSRGKCPHCVSVDAPCTFLELPRTSLAAWKRLAGIGQIILVVYYIIHHGIIFVMLYSSFSQFDQLNMGRGCASVLKTHLSNGIRSSSVNSRKRYFSLR